MINLTKKAANRFKIGWAGLSEQSGDHWKVDLFKIGRFPILLIVHEKTLSTLVRRKSEIKTIDKISKEIRRCCPWYPFPKDVTVGKNSNRPLSGSINEMKRYAWNLQSPDELPALEKFINNSFFS